MEAHDEVEVLESHQTKKLSHLNALSGAGDDLRVYKVWSDAGLVENITVDVHAPAEYDKRSPGLTKDIFLNRSKSDLKRQSLPLF